MITRKSLLLFAGLLSTSAMFAQPADVLPAQRRTATVELAERLVTPPAREELAPELKNPFAPSLPPALAAPAAGAARPAPVSAPGDRQLLEAMAPLVTPSGTMTLGGHPILLFGQKKIKVGDELPITFDGVPYVLVISAIDRTSFTLRLNGEEITRPIKPANRP